MWLVLKWNFIYIYFFVSPSVTSRDQTQFTQNSWSAEMETFSTCDYSGIFVLQNNMIKNRHWVTHTGMYSHTHTHMDLLPKNIGGEDIDICLESRDRRKQVVWITGSLAYDEAYWENNMKINRMVWKEGEEVSEKNREAACQNTSEGKKAFSWVTSRVNCSVESTCLKCR